MNLVRSTHRYGLRRRRGLLQGSPVPPDLASGLRSVGVPKAPRSVRSRWPAFRDTPPGVFRELWLLITLSRTIPMLGARGCRPPLGARHLYGRIGVKRTPVRARHVRRIGYALRCLARGPRSDPMSGAFRVVHQEISRVLGQPTRSL